MDQRFLGGLEALRNRDYLAAAFSLLPAIAVWWVAAGVGLRLVRRLFRQ